MSARDVADELAWRARIEGLLEQLLTEQRARKRGARKRSATVAQRAALTQYQPSELQVAAMQRRLARGRGR